MLIISESMDEAGDDLYTPTPMFFQTQLFNYLDNDAPSLPRRQQEFSNLVLLFYELIYHDVFSHDQYMCQLISRGDLLSPAAEDASGNKKQGRYSVLSGDSSWRREIPKYRVSHPIVHRDVSAKF